MTSSTSHSPVNIPPPPVVPAPKRSTPPLTAVNSRTREQPIMRVRRNSHSPAESRRHGNHNVKKSYKTAQAAGFTVLESMSGVPWNTGNDKKKQENYHKKTGRSHSNSPVNSVDSSHRSISGSPSLNATR